jgi:hypothetical protein
MASFDNAQLSGLAGRIRQATESDDYDLGGYTEQRAKDLIITSFSQPLPNPTEMIRFMFTVGGGKLVRSRYPDDLTKWLVAALREINFTEDRSAACTLDSQGTFKQQHDTDQNLKYLIIFPRLSIGASSGEKVATAITAELDTTTPVKYNCDIPFFSFLSSHARSILISI